MHVTLVGGGWDPAAFPATYGPFLSAAGSDPRIATVVVDEGDGGDQFRRWAGALQATAPCSPYPVLVPLGAALDVDALGGADGVLVCGGLTPAYADALHPAATRVRDLVRGGMPYAGFSAGAAIASAQALVGGWRDGDIQVCADEAGEDLDQVTVRPGLGLVEATVDVHCAQWGTLSRLVSAVTAGHASSGWGLDEGTAVHVVDGAATVAGAGRVYAVTAEGAGNAVKTGQAQVRTLSAGETLAG